MAHEFEGETYTLAMADYNRSLIDQQAAYQRAALEGDPYSAKEALKEMAAIKVQANEAHRLAVEHAASMQQPQGNRFNLSADEVDLAHGHPDDNKSNEAKEELFVRNKQRYQINKSNGLHRDDQGGR
jgi:hypothetical protein